MSWRNARVYTDHKWLSENTMANLDVYNYADLLATGKLYQEWRAEPGENETFYQTEIQPFVPAVAAMRLRGVPISTDRRTELREQYRARLADVDSYIRDVAGSPEFNPNSNPQAARLLFGELGLRPSKRTESGEWSVDEESLHRTLDKLRKRDEPHRTLLHAFLHRSRINTILTRYMAFPVDEDGFAWPTVKFPGTPTLRFAYADPPFQQWPEEIRSIVEAKDGYRLVSADLSQAEARIKAILFQDSADLAIIASGRDLHRETARQCIEAGRGVGAWDQLDPAAQASARQAVKTVRYRKAYGGGHTNVYTKRPCPCVEWGCNKPDEVFVGIDSEDVAAMGALYERVHADSERTIRATLQSIFQQGYYDAPGGFRRRFLKRGAQAEREALNFPMQFTTALVMIRAQTRLHRLGAPIFMQMHDQLLLHVPAPAADYWAETLQTELERPVPELGGASIPAEPSIGRNWEEAH